MPRSPIKREVDAKRKLIVGVNAFVEPDEKPLEVLTVNAQVETRPDRRARDRSRTGAEIPAQSSAVWPSYAARPPRVRT